MSSSRLNKSKNPHFYQNVDFVDERLKASGKSTQTKYLDDYFFMYTDISVGPNRQPILLQLMSNVQSILLFSNCEGIDKVEADEPQLYLYCDFEKDKELAWTKESDDDL